MEKCIIDGLNYVKKIKIDVTVSQKRGQRVVRVLLVRDFLSQKAVLQNNT
jgi:hypothetical protein